MWTYPITQGEFHRTHWSLCIASFTSASQDVKVLKLTPNPSPNKSTPLEDDSIKAAYVCPLTLKEMIGTVPFVYLATCGCVFTQAGLKTVSHSKDGSPKSSEGEAEDSKHLNLCPQCGAKYDKVEDVVYINPSVEDEEKMRSAMDLRRLAEPVKTKSKKRKAAAAALEESAAKKKSTVNSANSGITSTTRAVAASLAEEEAKRKAGMSDAIKSLYTQKDGPKRKETFMTMNTFTRVSFEVLSGNMRLKVSPVCLIEATSNVVC